MKKGNCFLLASILALLLGVCSTGKDNDNENDDDQDTSSSDTDADDTDDETDDTDDETDDTDDGTDDTDDDTDDGTDDTDDETDDTDSADTDTDEDFEACIASLEECNFDALETPCASMATIPIPLTGGGKYGPVKIEGGPYGTYVEWNAGKGTEFVTPISLSEPVCDPVGVMFFGEPASVNREILNLRGLKFNLYTIFRPACMKEGEKYPVITWANGTCGQTGGYGALLAILASHGYVVVASNSRWTDTGRTNRVQLRALDYAKALNEDPTSIYYQRLDMDKIGAMGHSQGSAATVNAASDPRIKALILLNGHASNKKPFLYIAGDRDIGNPTPRILANATNAATQPGAWLHHHKVLRTGGMATGHLVLMEQPDRVIDMTVAWWKYMLHGDQEAKKMFVGPDCGLCNQPEEFEYGTNSLLQ
ncbi:MAG: hypothetical protein GY847_27135 [Proteobacteria bacterium]|nr:hypothetical protein [Pseudomonadota bacterium]